MIVAIFIGGVLVGTIVGMVLMAMMAIARQADDAMTDAGKDGEE